ncbi:MAG: NAD(+) kinase [Methylococcaceae bacterium]|nr:NAD(+) kinase [Methylococcaceae bacterium]
MLKSFKTIGIIGKYSDSRIANTILEILSYLQNNSYKVLVDSKSAALLSPNTVIACEIDLLSAKCDLIIAIGGDGTFLSAARASVTFNTPLIGINLGRLGFLVDISPEYINLKLNSILAGNYLEDKRYLLQTKIIRDGETIHQETAVNEVVVHRWVTPSMLEIVTHIDGIFLNSQRSDGLIISTPTGSTAYSLSAGGPILHPSLHALVLVPLNAHTLSNRPIVVDDSSEIEISFKQSKQISALVTCDHLEIPKISINDKILIKKLPDPITILHPEDHDFFHILREKLSWSSGYHI